MFNNYLHIFAKTFVDKRHGFKTKHHFIRALSIHSSSNIYFCLLCARHWDKGWRYIGEQKRHDLCSYGSYSTSVLNFEAVMKTDTENVFRHQWNWVTAHAEGGWSRRMGEGWTENPLCSLDTLSFLDLQNRGHQIGSTQILVLESPFLEAALASGETGQGEQCRKSGGKAGAWGRWDEREGVSTCGLVQRESEIQNAKTIS